MDKRKNIKWLINIGIVYALVIVLLVYVESNVEGSSINGFWDAFWFSIVTLTTVGYGDIYPVTILGKIIGLFLVLCSLGILSTIIGASVSFFTSELLPNYRLKKLSHKQWNVFVGENDESKYLASKLDKDAVTVFLTEDARIESENSNVFYMDKDEDWILSMKSDARFFYMSEDGMENYIQASYMSTKTNASIYCKSMIKDIQCNDNLNLFNPVECLGRFYWVGYPVHQNEKKFILVGNGDYANSLLERALLLNIFDPNRHLEYILVGDFSTFYGNHYELQNTKIEDSLKNYASIYDVPKEDFEDADRIILCMEDERENLSLYQQLKQYFITKGEYHLHLPYEMDNGLKTFGRISDLYTPEMVMQEKRYEMAIALNEMYRQSVNYPAPSWDELSEFHRQSNIAAADHIFSKCRILLGDEKMDALMQTKPDHIFKEAFKVFENRNEDELYEEIEHIRWMRFHILNNWKYNPVRNNDKRMHHLLVPFKELAKEEQVKDLAAWELIGEFKEK